MSWTVAGAVVGGVAGSFAGGFSITAGAQAGATVGALLDGVSNRPKAPKVHQDRFYSGAQYESPIARVWGAVRIDVGIIWVARNDDGTFYRIESEGGDKKKGVEGVPHAHATYAIAVAETGLTFPNGGQVERKLTIDRIYMGDQIVYTGPDATPVETYAGNEGKTYGFGDYVLDADGFVYSSKAEGNVGHDPSASPDWWQKVSATKKSIEIVRHPDVESDESTFTMAVDSIMATHDGIDDTRAYRTLDWFLVPSHDLFELGNSLPSNASVECHTTEELTDGDFLSDAFQLAGLLPEEFDVSQCTDALTGIAQTSQTSIQDLIANFLIAKSYDLVEVDGKVTPIKRGGAVVRRLEPEELGAEEGTGPGGQQVPRALVTDRRELHSSMVVSYNSPTRNFRKVGALAPRQDAVTYNPTTFDSGMTLGDDEAARMAYRIIDTEYLENGDDYGPFALSNEHSDLIPSDVVEIFSDGDYKRFRIEQTNTGKTFEIEVVRDEIEVLNQEATGDPGRAIGDGLSNKIKSLTFVVASPPKDPTDLLSSYPGVYVWASDGNKDGKPISGRIFFSFDDFATDALSGGVVTKSASFGPVSDDALPSFTGAPNTSQTDHTVFDPAIPSTMAVLPGVGTTLNFILNGANPTLIGDEWVGVRNTLAPSGGSQQIGPSLFRRLYGSPGDGHVVGELLAYARNVSNLVKFRVDPLYVGSTVYVRVLAPGQSLEDVTSQTCVVVDPSRPYAMPTTPFQETPTGIMDGANTTFGLTHAPVPGTLILTKNGAQQFEGTNFTIAGTTITTTVAPIVTDVLFANYRFSAT